MPALSGKVALVTGGASGIGKAVAKKILEKGAKLVAILDFNEKAGLAVSGEFETTFGKDKVMFLQCDVSNETQLRKCFQEVYDVHQTIDVLLNNAGVGNSTPIKLIQINLISVLWGVQIVAEMAKKNPTNEKIVVVNTSSMAGVMGGNPLTPCGYVASKHGVVGLTRALGISISDGLGENIRAAAICPGLVDTAIVSSPEELRKQLPVDKADAIIASLAKAKYTPMVIVEDAFLNAIEDDSLPSGSVFTVTDQGIKKV